MAKARRTRDIVHPVVLEGLRPHTKLFIEVHLMVEEPAKFFAAVSAAGGDSVNFTVVASSSRAKAIGAAAGSTRHPAGACSVTLAVAAPFWLLAIVTLTIRPPLEFPP